MHSDNIDKQYLLEMKLAAHDALPDVFKHQYATGKLRDMSESKKNNNVNTNLQNKDCDQTGYSTFNDPVYVMPDATAYTHLVQKKS